MECDQYEEDCKAIQEINNGLLELFEQDLIKSGLSEKTINRHLSNVDFYINNFLLHEDAYSMNYGVSMIGDFLGNFFIRKCMWSTPESIKSTAASIKKFYKSMLGHGKIKKKEYDFLLSEIKDGMADWQNDCALFNDPDSPNPFYFF